MRVDLKRNTEVEERMLLWGQPSTAMGQCSNKVDVWKGWRKVLCVIKKRAV